MTLGKRIFSIGGGILTAVLLLSVLEDASFSKFTEGKVIDPSDHKSMQALIQSLPMTAFYCQLGIYALAAFVGGLVATLIGGRTLIRPALIVGLALTSFGIFNTISLHEPTWFMIASSLIYLPCALLGFVVGRKR